MKKITYILLACLTLVSFSACSLKEDESFEKSASERSAENMANVQKVLLTASNGWLMEYYGDLNMGGYNVMVKFEGENATFASEKWGTNHKAGIGADGKCVTTTSHYKLEQSMGTIISFDEYNETFHYYSMPANPDYTYDMAEGLYGDFEFRVMKATADSVILRGKKHNNRIIMTPIPADKTWESYITEAQETETYMSSRSYTLSGEDYTKPQEITVTNNGSYRCLIFTYKDSTDQKVTVAAPYIVKKDGFYFYYPVNVNGVELDGLLRGDTDDYFLFRNNQKLQLDTYMPTLVESIVTGNWYMRYGSVGEYAKPKWDAMLEILKTAGKNKQEIKIYTATIGLTSDNKLCSSMSTSTDQPYWGFNGEDVSKAKDGTKIKFSQNSTVRNKAGKDYYSKYKWSDVLNCVYGHTFELSCDYQRRPQWIKMTDVDEPTNVITIYSTPTYFIEDQSYYQDN